MRISSNSESIIDIIEPVYKFTEAGIQLYETIINKANGDYVIDYAKKLKLKNNNCEVSAHKVNIVLEDGRLNYDDEDILNKE